MAVEQVMLRDHDLMVSGERIGIVVLACLYALANIRLYPGDWGRTLWATGRHLAGAGPFVAGLALFCLVLGRRLAGLRPSAANFLRLFLCIGLFVELLYGIHHYLATAAP